MNSPVRLGSPRYPSRLALRVSARLSQILRFKWALLPLLLVLVWPVDAQAYAWMLRHGYTKCDSCHTDPSGGETLNHMGRVQSEMLLSADWGNESVTSDAKLFYSLDEPNHLRLGGSVRGMGIYTAAKDPDPSKTTVFPMQMDVYGSGEYGVVRVGGSLGLGKVKRRGAHNLAAQVTQTQEGYTLLSRSHWLGFDLGQSWLLRAGRLNLPFGIRTSEHTLLVRQETHTDRESDQQHGAAISYSAGNWRGEGMFVLGNFQAAPDAFRERGFTGYTEYIFDTDLAVGLSTLVLQSERSLDYARQRRTLRHAHGATLRYVPFDLLAILTEVDVLKTSGRNLGYAGFLTADVELMQGLHVAGTFDFADGGKIKDAPAAVEGNGKMTRAIWGTLQWYFYTHWDMRVDAVMRKGSPLSLQAQIHHYF